MNEIRIKLISYDFRLLDQWVKKIIEITNANNVKIKGPIPLPTKKEIWTFQRSPHVNKPSMEQFERRTHKRLIVLTNFNNDVMVAIQRLVLPADLEVNFEIK
ncbi:small subunit ribosomal protein S10 [Mycoplasmoides fastidiosum]|uniref:Small ribosomal subunit protein uS10 n=1 Tax=Mycoplasmoides fastidiosum TaxID=92758 RepID=A0ABU0LY81_9BACT|nr:30S ribosomal protein S10 [Mycoplasmoides fastidiosum]MDQ0513635.1 small subunit ribosomal protein S10 [Mycoplasmoides fastidiosum]UUD37945.1 30S ribosomal protein S10 [Mycoplasmoides fastidiosum]